MPLFGLPALWAGLSGAAKLSMIGGVAGAALDQRNRNRDEYLNSPKGIREQAEAAGFDPLLFTGAAGSFGAGYAPTMGSKISTAFSLAGDQQQRELELKLQKTELEQENARLTELQRRTTLTNNRGGIYDSANQNDQKPDDFEHRAASSGDADDGNVKVAGLDVVEYGGNSGAQEFEDRYGDLVSWAAGVMNLGADGAKTAYEYGKDYGNRMKIASEARAQYGVEPYNPHTEIITSRLPNLSRNIWEEPLTETETKAWKYFQDLIVGNGGMKLTAY